MNNALITDEQRTVLLTNGRASLENTDFDPVPVVKLFTFTPDAGATWLLGAIDPEGGDLCFGLCDLGLGMPEWGYLRFSELEGLRANWVCRWSGICTFVRTST